MANGCYSPAPASRSSSSRPTSATTCSTTADRGVRRRRRRARPTPRAPTTVWTATKRGAALHLPQRQRRPDHRRRSSVPARRARPAAPPTPSRRSTSPATRTPASRRSRRCAATSTRTPTAWPSSSSAATRTAASPWHEYGAPYALVDCPDHTATGGYGGVLESVAVRRAAPRPGRLADVQGLAGAGVAHPRGHLLPLAGARRGAAGSGSS